MMQEQSLALSGWGQLITVTEQENYFNIVFHTRSSVNNNSSTEMLCINCEVKDKMQQIFLRAMREELAADNIVHLQFEARYSSFGCYYCGLTSDDPKLMIHLNAELQTIVEFDIDNAFPDRSLINKVSWANSNAGLQVLA